MDKKMTDSVRKLSFPGGIYSREAVRLAAYVFSDRADIKLTELRGGMEAEVECGTQCAAVAGEFANEVLSHQCRLDLAARNGEISRIIVTKALLAASGVVKKGKGRK